MLKKPEMFGISGLPRKLYGRESYLLVASWQPSPTSWKAEYHILTNRPQERLISGHREFWTHDYPDELEPVNETFMSGEGQQAAQNALIAELDQHMDILEDSELAFASIEFHSTNVPLVTLWRTNVYADKLKDIAAKTSCENLKKYLNAVMRMEKLRAPGS